MKFVYGRNDWKTWERGQENCYLLTNGLGGFSSLTMLGSMVRNDHALFMGCTKAPNNRYHIISRMEETIAIGADSYTISSQGYVNNSNNQKGYLHLNTFLMDNFPKWIYQVGGVEVKKELAMKQGKNTLVLRYQLRNLSKETVALTITPQMQFVRKGEFLMPTQDFRFTDSYIESNGIKLSYVTNGKVEGCTLHYETDLYYPYDARDGRAAVGSTAANHTIRCTADAGEVKEYVIIYSLEESYDRNTAIESAEYIFRQESNRMQELMDQAGINDKIGACLVKSADQFIVNRESIQGKTIIAGYPFFEDWGRDTMIAVVGCCIATKRYEDAKNIFRTFMKYCRRGIMPNIFPEGGNEPAYNTVDASLLFIGAVYEYYLATKDKEFVTEAYPVMKDIVEWYQKGTDFHIKMDTDGLIMAGGGCEQVTWMDVRIGDILPTPRHGKPVEVNAYWYNDLKIMECFSKFTDKQEEGAVYGVMAEKTAKSFREKFWNSEKECLKDVLTADQESLSEEQVRCNQIWAVSVPFGMLEREQEKSIVEKVYTELYTPYGLRSLSPKDPQFHPHYGGTQLERDLGYHQGTVWGFPLGAYYLAYLKCNDGSKEAAAWVREQLSALEPCLREGCIGQIAEIYDGQTPSVSRGCFAQAWSVGELLRVFLQIEEIAENEYGSIIS